MFWSLDVPIRISGVFLVLSLNAAYSGVLDCRPRSVESPVTGLLMVRSTSSGVVDTPYLWPRCDHGTPSINSRNRVQLTNEGELNRS